MIPIDLLKPIADDLMKFAAAMRRRGRGWAFMRPKWRTACCRRASPIADRLRSGFADGDIMLSVAGKNCATRQFFRSIGRKAQPASGAHLI